MKLNDPAKQRSDAVLRLKPTCGGPWADYMKSLLTWCSELSICYFSCVVFLQEWGGNHTNQAAEKEADSSGHHVDSGNTWAVQSAGSQLSEPRSGCKYLLLVVERTGCVPINYTTPGELPCLWQMLDSCPGHKPALLVKRLMWLPLVRGGGYLI